MKKILFVINSLKNKSGLERVACLMANTFSEELDYSVCVINRDAKKEDGAYFLNDNVNVLAIGGGYLNFFMGLNSYIKINKPDTIIVHNMGRLSLLCSMLDIKGSRLVSLEHVAFSIRPQWVRFLSKKLYKNIDQVVTLTNNDALSYKGFHNNIVKINNISPFDVEDVNSVYNSDSKNIIAIGRLTYQKNFEDLLKAWELVLNQKKEWTLSIYGKGEDKNKLENLINEKKLTNVFLRGEITNVEEIYCSASFYVMSSRFEGLPMVLIEAQSLGLPIVSYNCPHGPSEIIENNVTGYLVENNNVQELAQAILSLMDSSTLREQFSKRAKEHALVYSQRTVIKEWIKVVEN
ncbi:glycosyltransferase family 4 protein [Acinetobacter sp. Ac_5812]|uniref:glycosyltransferase family 4 protein n=1 Tax=Acinetobacter sp. Ac_5812 TaxID=1848937 RepID=UPI001D4D7677|nr:hypothetical protein [Acinetobacter sp. Ac_5812]